MTSHPRLSGSQNCRISESRDARLHSTKVVATQQPWLKPSRLQNLGLTARAGLQDKH